MTGHKKPFDHKELLNKMSLSAQRSVAESFKFNGKKLQSVHVKAEECFVSRDVYKAIGYEEKNGKKVIQKLVPNKYKLRFGDVNSSLNQWEDAAQGYSLVKRTWTPLLSLVL